MTDETILIKQAILNEMERLRQTKTDMIDRGHYGVARFIQRTIQEYDRILTTLYPEAHNE